MEKTNLEQLDIQEKPVLYSMVSLIPPDQLNDWMVTSRLASHLLTLNEHECNVILDQIGSREAQRSKPAAQQEANHESTPDVKGFLKEVFTFPPIDKERLHCEPCMREENEKILHVAFGIISPLSKLKWLGSGFIVEGKYIGEGKDAIVHAVKGSSEWVIKELKFGGEERAKMLEFYTNKLAEDLKFKVPELIHLDGGRLLQKFVQGSPTANTEFALHQLAAQQEAVNLAAAAKQALGIRAGEEFIKHGPYKVGVDPSFANFLYNSEGKLEGWIDPLYSINR